MNNNQFSSFPIPNEWKVQGLPYNDESVSLLAKSRTKEDMFSDVVNTLNSNLTPKAKYDILDAVFSDWTEFYGKHEGCKFWSKKAIGEYREKKNNNPNFKAKDNGKVETDKNKHFVHEHIVPKISIMRMFLSEQDPNEFFVYEKLVNNLIGAVILKEEDTKINKQYRSTLPNEFYDENDPLNKRRTNPWWRYIKNNIDIVLCEWDAEGNLIGEPLPWDLQFDMLQSDVILMIEEEIKYQDLLRSEKEKGDCKLS